MVDIVTKTKSVVSKLSQGINKKKIQKEDSQATKKFKLSKTGEKSFKPRVNPNKPPARPSLMPRNPAVQKILKTKKGKPYKKSLKQIFKDQGLMASRERVEFYKNFKERLKRNKTKRSLRYIYYVKKFKNGVEYTNIRLLKVFLTKYAKIKAKRKTRIRVQQHRFIAKSIRKARVLGLLPFTCNLKIF